MVEFLQMRVTWKIMRTFRASVRASENIKVSSTATDVRELILRRSFSRTKGKIAIVSNRVPKAAWTRNMTKNL